MWSLKSTSSPGVRRTGEANRHHRACQECGGAVEGTVRKRLERGKEEEEDQEYARERKERRGEV